MPLVVKPFPITMELYETDKFILEKFIETIGKTVAKNTKKAETLFIDKRYLLLDFFIIGV